MSVELRRLIRNFLALVTGNVIIRVANFISTLYIARRLGPADFGQLSFALAVAFACSYLINVGLDNLLVREVAREAEGRSHLLGDTLLLKLIALPLGAWIAIVLSFVKPGAMLLFLLLAGYTIAYSYLLLCCAVFRGLERMWFQTLLLAAQSFLVAVGAVVAVRLTGQVLPVTGAHLLATALVLVGGYFLLLRQGLRPHYRWQPAAWWRLLRTTLPFGLTTIGLAIYDRQGIVVIGLLSGEAAVGWFNAGYAIILVLANFPANVVNTLFPLLARRAQRGPRTVAAVCETVLRYSNVVGFPLAACLVILAPSIVPLLFGSQYRESIVLFQLLAPGLPFIFLSVILVGVLQTSDRQQSCARGVWAALAIATPGCVLATWIGGYQAGTLAYSLSHILLAATLLRLTTRAVGGIRLREAFGRPGMVTAALGLIAYLVRAQPLLLAAAVLLLCYLALLLLTGTLGRQEWALLRGMLQDWRWGRKLTARLGRGTRADDPPRGGGFS